jgi:hypothetical protein
MEVFGMLRRFVLLTALAAGVIAVCAVPAMAKEFRVDDFPKLDCPNADFTTIQAAVDAAGSGDQIKVCPGNYPEHVVIEGPSKNKLKLESTKKLQAHVQFPMTPPSGGYPDAIVLVRGSQDVKIKGFTIEGPWSDSPGVGCAQPTHYGVRVDGGGDAKIEENHITQIQDAIVALRGCQDGLAIRVGRYFETPTQTGSADIVHNTIDTYQKNGVTIDGTGSSAKVEHNTIDGGGSDPIIAKNGVQIGRGAEARVHENDISGNSYTGVGPPPPGDAIDDNDATGILVFEVTGGVELSNNDLAGNDLGVELGGRFADEETPDFGATTGVLIKDNKVTNSVFDGLRANEDALQNKFENNKSSGSGSHDCHDDSAGGGTAGTANTWKGNKGVTQTPAGICKP